MFCFHSLPTELINSEQKVAGRGKKINKNFIKQKSAAWTMVDLGLTEPFSMHSYKEQLS